MIRLYTVLVLIVMVVGCQGFNLGYKDPESGVVVDCVTKNKVTRCFYVGPDGKEIHVSGPVIGQDIKPIPE